MSFTSSQVEILRVRDGNQCAWHGSMAPGGICNSETLIPQHRANRGMGGQPSLDRLSNGVLLCSFVNGLIESSALMAEEAIRRGIKISSYAEPSEIPVQHAVHGECLLDDVGGVQRSEPSWW